MSSLRESYAHLSDGRPVHYFEEGSGLPFLYAHCATGTADLARGMFDTLQDRFHCIAFD